MASDSDVLRLAAARLKSEHGLNDTQHDRFMLAVAVWLEAEADDRDEAKATAIPGLAAFLDASPSNDPADMVARAYLREGS
jgi:hypothetical protein